MELARPTIAEAIAECAELGASTVIVAPFFLSRRVSIILRSGSHVCHCLFDATSTAGGRP